MKLTKEQAKHLAEYVLQAGIDRRNAQGREFRSEDFIAGAMCAFFAFDSQDMLPPSWVFGMWSGRDPLDSTEETRLRRCLETSLGEAKERDELLREIAARIAEDRWNQELIGTLNTLLLDADYPAKEEL